MLKRIALLIAILVTAMAGIETGASFIATGRPGLALPAEAVVGRPVTPVSVAGVARRSVRRCAATVVVC
jgi:hypothetical protein